MSSRIPIQTESAVTGQTTSSPPRSSRARVRSGPGHKVTPPVRPVEPGRPASPEARLASDFLWSDLPAAPAAQELAAPSLPRFVTIVALAAALGVNERTIRRGIKKGLIRTAPLGGRLVRIPVHEVDRLIAGEPLPAPGGRKEDQSVTDINDYS